MLTGVDENIFTSVGGLLEWFLAAPFIEIVQRSHKDCNAHCASVAWRLSDTSEMISVIWKACDAKCIQC